MHRRRDDASAGGAKSERAAVAALLALVAAFLFEAGIDWMWELTAVSVVAIFALGLLTGPATEPAFSGLQAVEARRRVSPVFRIAVAAIAFGLIVAEAIPLLANMEVRKSQDSVNSGNLVQALDQAESARSIQPWAATPYLQLALVQELGGQIDEAHGSIEHALENDQSDWRLWLVAARIQTKAGDIAAARAKPRQGARAEPEVAAVRGLSRQRNRARHSQSLEIFAGEQNLHVRVAPRPFEPPSERRRKGRQRRASCCIQRKHA